MSGFDSKRTASKDLLQQALDALMVCAAGNDSSRSMKRESIDAIRQHLAQPAVAEPLKDWEFVAMWATAAEKHDDTYDVAVEFGRAVEQAHGIKGSKT